MIGYLNKTAQEYGFGEVVSGERVSRTNVPKTHANPSSRPRPPRLQPAPRLRTKPPIHPPKLKQKRANCILPYSKLFQNGASGGSAFIYRLSVCYKFSKLKRKLFCGIFVEIQLRIRVELSKTKTGGYIPAHPGRRCTVQDTPSKYHSRNHPDHC